MDSKTTNIKQKTKKILQENSRVLWALFFTAVILLIVDQLFFKSNPVFKYPYLVEVIGAIIVFLILYFYGSLARKHVTAWVEKIIENTFSKILNNFWSGQTDKLVDAIKSEKLVTDNAAKYQNVVLDTSAVIDGRIFGVITTGFLDNVIMVPQNVIDELQYLADKSDNMKRQKGRMGLDNLRSIKKFLDKSKFITIDMKTKPEDVDKSLVMFCKKNDAKIATVDYNLNKAAEVAGVEVLNVNKLANEIKTNVLPGDIINVKIIQKGTEKNQAVGYLDDGTMVVVTDAIKYLSKEKNVKVEKVLQTSAGRMIFASIEEVKKETKERKKLFFTPSWVRKSKPSKKTTKVKSKDKVKATK